MFGPLDQIDQYVDEHLQRILARKTAIPSIAGRAKAAASDAPAMVRADIGQIIGVDEELEVLYGPPVGLQPLREAVAELYRLSFRLGDEIGAENVNICTGAAEALSILFRLFASGGRRVGLPRGHWSNYLNGVELAGGEAVVVDFFDEAGELDIAGLEREIAEQKLAVLVANFPNNPTGAVLDEDEARQLGELAVATNTVIIADEVYARLRYDGQPACSLLRHAPAHAISLGSASKEYLVPGARVGYVVSARSDLTDRVLRKLVRANTATPNVLGQRQVIDMLSGDLAAMRKGAEPPLATRIRAAMRERRDALLAVLERHGMPSVGRAGHRPEGTIFLMAKLPAWWSGDDAAFVDRAIEDGLFSGIPGSAFGLPGSVRFSYGATDAAAIERLDGHLVALRDAVA